MTVEATPGAVHAPGVPLVSLQGVTKTFRTSAGSDIRAIGSVDLDVDAGEFVAIVGPSGCGKSTLLALMAGLESLSDGSVTVAGQEITEPFTDLGIVFQDDLLLEWRTVLDNILIQAEVRRMDKEAMAGRTRVLLGQVGLSDFEGQYPDELSGGMRQRVALCRALVHDPPLLLMDEPFAALDALTRDQMALDLQSISDAQGKTVVFVTHSVSEAVLLADTVYVMSPRPGTIAARMEIELERPRHLDVRESAKFGGYVHEIIEIFKQQGVISDV